MKTNDNELVLPAEFSGNAQLLLYTRYDDPRTTGWEHKWIINWKVQQLHPWFPTQEIKIHKHFWPILNDALFALEKEGLHREITEFHRCHELAMLPDSTVLSVHSWGAAIDLNPKENPMGSQGAWTRAFIDTMNKHNIFAGQNWTGNKEPMHFAMVDG